MRNLLRGAAALGILALAATAIGLPSAAAASDTNAQPNVSQTVLIQQVATSGPNGAKDSYVELRNVSVNPIDISGWHVKMYNASNVVLLDFLVPQGIVLSPKFNTGQYLILTAPEFSGTILDQTNVLPFQIVGSTEVLPDNGGVALFNAQNMINKIDGVSFGPAQTPREGVQAIPLNMTTAQLGAASERDILSTDTDNNRVDFSLHARTPGAES